MVAVAVLRQSGVRQVLDRLCVACQPERVVPAARGSFKFSGPLKLAALHVIAKTTAIGDRINVTKRALPSLFQSKVPVLPGPPPN